MKFFQDAPAYWHIMRVSAREDRANPVRLAGSALLGVVRIILLAAIYKVAYDHQSQVGLPYANAVWSIALYFALIIGLSTRNVFKLIDRDVKTGAVEAVLVRPLDWRLTKVCMQIGKNLLEVAVISCSFFATLVLLIGLPDMSFISLGFLAGYLVIMLMAIVASSALFVAVGLTAFWLNDAQPTYRLVDKVILIFGGAFVPIALLPQAVQEIVRYSPFSMYAASTQLFNPGLAEHLLPTLVSSVIWTAVTIWFCNWVWGRVQKRIEVNGG